MATIADRPAAVATPGALRLGATLMALAGLAFIGYAVVFFVRNFTGAFLELGIGPSEVGVGRDEIQAFNPDLYHYIGHLHIAVSGFIAASGLATAALAWFFKIGPTSHPPMARNRLHGHLKAKPLERCITSPMLSP